MDPWLVRVYAEAYAWIADCHWADLLGEEVPDLTFTQVRRGIDRHYEGGWWAFVASCDDL